MTCVPTLYFQCELFRHLQRCHASLQSQLEVNTSRLTHCRRSFPLTALPYGMPPLATSPQTMPMPYIAHPPTSHMVYLSLHQRIHNHIHIPVYVPPPQTHMSPSNGISTAASPRQPPNISSHGSLPPLARDTTAWTSTSRSACNPLHRCAPCPHFGAVNFLGLVTILRRIQLRAYWLDFASFSHPWPWRVIRT